MTTIIRTVRVEEFEDFIAFLDRGFGQWKGFFTAMHPHLYQPTPESCSWGYVVEEAGKLVAHVGLYPLASVAAGVSLKLGGIGAVTTAPESRGKGYMSRLLTHVIGEMRVKGYPVSWLGGDRQRYNTFGWELAGHVYVCTFSKRALERAGDVSPVPVRSVPPEEAIATITQFQGLPICHARRPYLAHQIDKSEMRYWIAEDGYIIVKMHNIFRGSIVELVSASGNEIGLIQALLDWTERDKIEWELSAWDEVRLARLMPYVSFWHARHNWLYRINDLTALLLAAKAFLQRRAASLRDFEVAVGIREEDRVAITTIAVHHGEVLIVAGREAETYVELSLLEAARLFLGGPSVYAPSRLPAGLLALLPVPVYVSQMDFV